MSDTEVATALAARTAPQPNKVYRTTMVIEFHNEDGFKWALDGAIALARERVIRLSMSRQGDPDTRVEVRTSRPRRSKQKGDK